MKPFGRILIVDDDRAFLEMYRDILSEDGYEVETATTRDSALARLDEADWDVVLLDQKLLGPGGPDQGVELIDEVMARVPGAKAIAVTAYATDASIERAFDAGVYDFLEKSTPSFERLLRVKVRNAVEAVRERGIGTLRNSEAEARIQALWQSLSHESDSNKKGLLLEELMLLIVRSIDGFHRADTRVSNQDEEIDIHVRNESRDPFWQHFRSPYILLECKNWSKPVDKKEFVLFQNKLQNRYGAVKLGFFVAVSGFTKSFASERQTQLKGDLLVVCVDPDGLKDLVESQKRNEVLKALCDRAIIERNGH